ncbi:hypothetical protein K239x_24110 [Planctomycetes bacterium K23_9]|uniref:Uncharacterized protein n=1 Tax=Stieleria marina TaxID=1930275 RepID=A0A517NTL2_9BACT|nr:hypothetical protein K239x_24110 [Planctomycetes bacterium K23_9]
MSPIAKNNCKKAMGRPAAQKNCWTIVIASSTYIMTARAMGPELFHQDGFVGVQFQNLALNLDGS